MSVKVIEKLPSDGFCKFRPDQLHIVRKICNMKDPENIRQAIEILKDWVQKQQYFNKKDLSDTFFEKLLVVSKGSLERSKTRLEKICTLRTIWPTHFEFGDVNSYMDDFKVFHSVLLPDTTEEGSRVSLSKLYDTKPLTTGLLTRFIQYAVSLCEYGMAHDYPNGFVAILDYRDVNLIDLLGFATRHFTLLQQGLTILTMCEYAMANDYPNGYVVILDRQFEGYGMRGIHLVTPSKAADTLVTFLKQLLTAKVGSHINVHKDTSTLFAYVPKNILPADMGGDAPPLKELQENFLKALSTKEHKEWMEEAQWTTINQSKKPKDCSDNEYIGMPGSFRTLSVD